MKEKKPKNVVQNDDSSKNGWKKNINIEKCHQNAEKAQYDTACPQWLFKRIFILFNSKISKNCGAALLCAMCIFTHIYIDARSGAQSKWKWNSFPLQMQITTAEKKDASTTVIRCIRPYRKKTCDRKKWSNTIVLLKVFVCHC